MNLDLNLEIKLRTERVWDGPNVVEEEQYLCFRHAVFAVMHGKKKIEIELGEYNYEYGYGRYDCAECEKERKAENERGKDEEDDDYDPSMDEEVDASDEPHNKKKRS